MSKQELKAKPKAKSKMEFWTPTEKENTKAEYGCEILDKCHIQRSND